MSIDNEEVIINDTSLGLIVRNILLREKKRDSKYDTMDYKKFTKKELSTILELDLERSSFTDISCLKYFTNLKHLSIISANPKAVSSIDRLSSKYTYLSNLNKITDFSVISELTNLETLTIQNDVNLSKLDVSKLKRLYSLSLINNEKLTEIKGLDTLTNLTELTLFRNNIKKVFDLAELFDFGLNYARLDVDLYPKVIKKNKGINDIIGKEIKNGLDFKWVENLSNFDINEINYKNMEKMHNESLSILVDNIDEDYSDMEKIMMVYLYIINYVNYDYEAYNGRKNGENIYTRGEQVSVSGEFLNKTYNRINSSYNAIVDKKSVCEGFTNMMHYLLTIVGIESRTVGCNVNSSSKFALSDTNHSIIRVNVDGNWFYFDPTSDNKNRCIRNFFKTKNEISKSVSLSLSELSIISPCFKPYSNKQLTEMANNIYSKFSVPTNDEYKK